jgi:sortase A
MTVTKPAAATELSPAPATSAPRRRGDVTLRTAGLVATLLAVVLLGFVGYLYVLSGVQESRAQDTLFTRLQSELRLGVAPIGPTAQGNPVAVLDIPAIGIRNAVVVEGTTPEDLTAGPGLLRDTVLPGQAGISVIFGRRASFGAPFRNVPDLRAGDVVTALTSQGTSVYQVIGVASSARPVPFHEYQNTLLLITADSSFAPAHYIEVEAKLTSTAQQEPGGLPQIGQAEVALGRDPYALIPAMAWAIALAAAAIVGSYGAIRWSRWPAWIATIPVILAITWNLYQALSALLPNLY